MKRYRVIAFLFCLTLVATGGVLLFAHPAFAQATGSAGTFSCSGSTASGNLYTSSTSCPTTMSFSNIFSFLVCNMEQLSSNLLGNMFCGMITNLAPAVSAVLVIAVVLFGLSFTIGLIPATAKEFQMFLIKIACVWAFATQSDYIIGYAYAFFIDGIRDGVAIALTGSNATTGPLVYSALDNVLATLIHYGTDYIGATTTDPTQTCKNAIFVVLAIMAIAFPPIFLLAIALVFKVVITFVRAVFGYVYALVGIAFLLTLSPFFLSFFLFKQTRPFFDKWLGYMASFALQIVILFAFLSFILSLNVSNITNGFANLIIPAPVSETKETTSFRAPWEYCTVCDFQMVDANGAVLPDAQQASLSGKAQCKTGTDGKPLPITILSATAPDPSATTANPATTSTTSSTATASLRQKNALISYAGGGLLALVVLAYVVEGLLDYVASMAQALAAGLGTYAAPQLGGGISAMGRPVVQVPGNAMIGDAQRGFERGYGQGSNSITATASGFREAAQTLVHGSRTNQKDADGNTIYEGGLYNNFSSWLGDPNKMADE